MEANTVFKVMHVIDIDNSQVRANISIPDDFEAYIKELLKFVLENGNTKSYKVHDEQTQVIHCIKQAVLSCEAGATEQQILLDFAASVADKLLRVEEQAQEVIGRTGQNVKRGSLLQALIYEENQYYYILAKVEHQEWYDGASLQKSVGFPDDGKKAWKTAVVPITVDDGNCIFGVLKVYTDNAAKYWTKNFMEIEEMLSDEVNTQTVFTEVDRVLKRHVKKTSPSDYIVLRGALIQTLKTEQEIAYYDMIDKILGGYHAESEELRIDQVKTVLEGLPRKKRFDTNFRTVPSAITARNTRTKYTPTTGIELFVDGSVAHIKGEITSRCDSERGNLLEIRCTDPDVFATFIFRETANINNQEI